MGITKNKGVEKAKDNICLLWGTSCVYIWNFISLSLLSFGSRIHYFLPFHFFNLIQFNFFFFFFRNILDVGGIGIGIFSCKKEWKLSFLFDGLISFHGTSQCFQSVWKWSLSATHNFCSVSKRKSFQGQKRILCKILPFTWECLE